MIFDRKDEAYEAAIAEARMEARLDNEPCRISICVGPPCVGEAPSECTLCDVVLVFPDGAVVLDTNTTKQ